MFLEEFHLRLKSRKLLSLCTLLIFICSVLCGCKKEEPKKTKIVTSCYPVYIMALNLTEGLDDVEVLNMSENHKGCLHDYKVQPDDLKNIEKSDAFIINGNGMESFLEKVTLQCPNLKIIDSGKGIDVIDGDCHHHYEDEEEEEHIEHEHEHCDANPHTWVSISNYIKQVENIRDGLISLDDKNSAKYKENAEEYINKLSDLKSEMHSKIDNVKNKNIVTFHEAFPYFAKEFGLNIVTVLNQEPETEPSAKEISETIETIKNNNVAALFVEPQYSSKIADVVSSETKVPVHTLDPAVTGEKSKDAYIQAMRKNMEVLVSVLN